jgi:hypothetical protein
MDFNHIRQSWNWAPIRSCPGRFILRNEAGPISIRSIVGASATIEEHRAPGARDLVLVVELKDGGIISYLRENGSLIHTLNTAEGFSRKLAGLGIQLDSRVDQE